MKARVGCSSLCALLVAVALVSVDLSAQGRGGGQGTQEKKPLVDAIGTTEVPPLPPGGPTPRMSDGKPDLSGIWFSGNIGRPSAWSRTRNERVVEDPIPFKPDLAAKLKSLTRAQLEALDPT